MKKQTLILVLIGVILFIAGSAIAFASVQGAKKSSTSPTTQAPLNVSAVVAKSDIPAGTTGQEMISQGLVALQLVPSKTFLPTDLTSLQGLTDEVLSAPIQKGHAVSTTELTASTASISIPQNQDALTVTISGAGNLAGYLQPGIHVDVYANITKLSIGGAGAAATSGVPLPCTELAMSNIEVLDVSQTSPSLANSQPAATASGSSSSSSSSAPSASTAPAARSIPGSVTLLLALTPGQARTLQFLSQNESISVVQPQQGAVPPPVGQCIGTDQTTTAP